MRVSKLRRKTVKGHRCWYTAANGGAYFGRVDEVTWDAAKDKFANHIKRRQEEPVADDVVTAGTPSRSSWPG